MKILIAGDGKVGATLTRQLSAEGYDLTLIDSNQQVLENTLGRYDVLSVQGNCASMRTLHQAGAEHADLLIAATSADEINLLCCTTAHAMNPNIHTIARIRNPEYTDQIYGMRNVFALSMTVNPEKQAAAEIERLLKYPGFLKRETFAKGRVEIVELRVDAQSKLCDIALRELDGIVHCKVLVCTVLRDGAAVAPDGSFVLREGDRIFVTASPRELNTLLKSLGVITHKVSRVLLAGGGRVSYYLAQRLLQSGMGVHIIEQDPNRCRQLAGLLPQAGIIHGDASNMALLESEGIAQCDAIVTLTGLDELNMILSLCARRRGVPLVITKLGRVENVDVIDSLPLGSVVCPKELCCSTIVRYVRAMRNQTGAAVTVHSIADGRAEATEFLVDKHTQHCGEPLKALKLRRNVLIACITRGRSTEIPNGDSRFVPGDTVIVVTSNDTVLNQMNDIFA
ncbi:MAG: Trk system potassium transporter TrkA [Oscillospiraceae bacterium]|nr:Trk system potassium transporter TrkA [Oscillospiraceae bacterium]